MFGGRRFKKLGVSVTERGIYRLKVFIVYIGKCCIHRKLSTLPIRELLIKSATPKSCKKTTIWIFQSLAVLIS